MMTWSTGALGAAMLGACSSATPAVQAPTAARDARAPLTLAADDRMVAIPAGRFITGSTPEERSAAYDDYQRSAGNDTARTEQWFEREAERHVLELAAYRIDLMPVTQAQFAEYVFAERAPAPGIDEAGWRAEGFAQDFASQVARYVWKDGKPPDGREDHPVVLVSWSDADRYCAWRGALRGEKRRLPTADEYEKAARGDGGLAYPWGNVLEPDKLNSAIAGPKDTTPVGNYPGGASPFGVLDMVGNVREWTATPDGDQMVVKGSSWADFGGVGRGATVDKQPKSVRHVVIGFRCAADGAP
jgi:formylglycine-generating enzyme required for sulfatase activity